MTGILAFFRFVGWRNLLLILLLIAVYILVRRQFFADNPATPRVTSLFDKIEYVRELRLVTFYSEEILEIGAADAIARKIERQEEKMENARFYHQQLQAKAELSRSYAIQTAANSTSLEQRRRELIRVKDSLLSSFRDLDPGRNINVRKVERILKVNPRAFSPEIQNKVLLWSTLLNNQPEKQLFEQEIVTLARKEAQARQLAHEKALATVDQDIARIKIYLDQAKTEEDRSEKDARQANEEASKALNELRQDSLLWRSLTFELDRGRDVPLPKLIAVVSTEVSAYVDLAGMSSEINEQNLTLCGISPARIDSNVRIHLTTDNTYLTTTKLNALITGQTETEIKEGVYYYVFEEMQEEIGKMKAKVISEAIQRGILTQANEMATQYLNQMGRSLGFSEVEVNASCDPLSVAPVAAGQLDSLLNSTDQLRQRQDSLSSFMEDSLGVDMDSLRDANDSEAE